MSEEATPPLEFPEVELDNPFGEDRTVEEQVLRGSRTGTTQ